MFGFKVDMQKGPLSIGAPDTPVLSLLITEDDTHDCAYYAVYSNRMTPEQQEKFQTAVAALTTKLTRKPTKERKDMHAKQSAFLEGLLAFGRKMLRQGKVKRDV